MAKIKTTQMRLCRLRNSKTAKEKTQTESGLQAELAGYIGGMVTHFGTGDGIMLEVECRTLASRDKSFADHNRKRD